MNYVAIMAGGAGTRFWPASRRQYPKQLLNLVGERTMLQATVDRLDGYIGQDQLLILTNESLVESIASQLPDLPKESIVGEPAKRDTAPCIGLAAVLFLARDPDATMVVMPADHVIQPTDLFQQCLQQAVEFVNADPQQIVTLGVQPTYPAEVFGYIEHGLEPISGSRFPIFPVRRFLEKPSREKAIRFLEMGNFCWNSGIFVWKAKTIMDAIEEYEPQMYQHLINIQGSIGTAQFQQVLEAEFSAIEPKSIDFAVMEHYPHIAMIEAPFQWNDLGNWSAIETLKGCDANGNTIEGRHLGINTHGSLIRGEKDHLLVTIGVKDLVIVQTPNATLIADKNDEQAIKQIIQQLEEKQWNEYL